MKERKYFLVLTIVLFFFIYLSNVKAITIQPSSQDAMVDESNVAINYGNYTELDVNGKSHGSTKLIRSFVQFDLSYIPSGSTINSATLNLYMFSAPSMSIVYEVNRVTASWNENTTTWNNQPSNASTTATNSTGSGWLSWDVTSDVQSMVTGAFTNYGWVVRDQGEGASGEGNRLGKFYSKEYTTDTTLRPKLEISYTPPATSTTSSTTTTIPTTTTTLPQTCGITANPNPAFGSMNPGDTSSNKTTTIKNTGTSATTSLTVKGQDWSTGTFTMLVGQTHWSLSSSLDYDSMNPLTTGDVSLGQSINGGGTLPVHFKLRIPFGQSSGSYTQTITFTSGC